MTRASNTILGLPVPKEPIDLDAPRTRRKRRTEAEEPEMEEVSRPSGDVLPASNPESADKAASKQGRSKKKKTMNTPDVNHVDPAVSNTDMGAPPTDAAMTGSIAIGESIVPEGPPKKPRKKKATSTKPSEKAEAVDRGAPLQAAEVTTTVAGRVRNPSTLAKQVSKQASNKLLEREEKTRRKKEKAQRAVVVESLEATAQFVAATNGSSGAMATNANLEIRPAQIPIAPGGLQRIRQNEANNLIAQRVANRLLSTAPPSSTASNSGSEPLNFTSNWHGQPYSRATSRAPSGSIAPSREVSVAPSTRSSHLSATRSGESRTVSSYPPTRPMSPASDISGEVNTMGLTLDERYAGIPPELAPRLPVYEPLPAPFHEPERLVPVPYRDMTKLSNSDRKKYRQSLKIGVKDLVPSDRTIVSSALSRFEALVNVIDCFPGDDDSLHLMLVANAWACCKHMLGNLCLVKGDPYYDLMSSRLSQTKTGIVDLAIKMVPEEYNIKTLNLSPEIIEYNQSTVQYWLHEGNYTCPPKDFGALYERQIFTDILKNAFFASPNSTGVVHRDLFAVITIPTLAGVAAALEKALLKLETGIRVGQQFSRNLYRPKWASHVASLCDMFKSAEGDRLVKYLKELSTKLLAPYPTTADNRTTAIAPRIPLIASRYGRSIAAPPPPVLPVAREDNEPVAVPAPEVLPVERGRAKTKHRKVAPTPEPSLVMRASQAPDAPNKSSKVILNPRSESKLESISESEPGEELGGELGEEAPANVDDPAAWVPLNQATSSSMAQYDALHALVAAQGFGTQEVISPATHVAPPGNDSSLHSDESDESAGEGDSGAGNLTKERGGAERSNDEDEDDSSGSEPETGDEN